MFKKMLVYIITILIISGICFGYESYKELAAGKLVTDEGIPLEPSGVEWDPDLKIAVGVSDEFTTIGYEIFAFDPMDIKDGETVLVVTPLLSLGQYDRLKPDDLEGITRTPSGQYYAFTSLSLDREENSPEDSWQRFQAFTFKVVRRTKESLPEIIGINRISEDIRPDFREWLISSSGHSWKDDSYRKRAEHGGINVEGVSNTSGGNILMGLRGPLEDGHNAPVLIFKDNGTGKPPEPLNWLYLDVSKLPGNETEKKRGIRGIDRLPIESGFDKYMVILGPTGVEHLPFRLVCWEPFSNKVTDIGNIVENAIPEGVAVMEYKNDTLKLLFVDDIYQGYKVVEYYGFEVK